MSTILLLVQPWWGENIIYIFFTKLVPFWVNVPKVSHFSKVFFRKKWDTLGSRTVIFKKQNSKKKTGWLRYGINVWWIGCSIEQNYILLLWNFILKHGIYSSKKIANHPKIQKSKEKKTRNMDQKVWKSVRNLRK